LDEDVTALGYLSRRWLSNILVKKRWSVPKWVKKVMAKDKTYRYTTKWKNKFCQSITLDDAVHNLWTSNVLHDKRMKEHQQNTAHKVAGYSNTCSDEAGSSGRQENVQLTTIPCKDLSDPLFLHKTLEYIESLPMIQKSTELYTITLPFTSEGYMVRILEETDFETGYSTMIRHYKCHANGELPTVQKDNVLRNIGDLVAEVDGHDMSGQSFEYVLTFIQQVAEEKRDLKLCMIDRTRIACEFIPEKTTMTETSTGRKDVVQPRSKDTSPVKHVPVPKPIHHSNAAIDTDCNKIVKAVLSGTPTSTNHASVSVSAPTKTNTPSGTNNILPLESSSLSESPDNKTVDALQSGTLTDYTSLITSTNFESVAEDLAKQGQTGTETLTKTTPVMEAKPMGTEMSMGDVNEAITQGDNENSDVDISDTSSESNIGPPPWRTPGTQAEFFLATFKEKANVVIPKKTRRKKEKKTTLVSAPRISSTRFRRLRPSRKPYKRQIGKELIDTDDDESEEVLAEEQVVEWVQKNSRLCTNCTFGIINQEKCSRCRRPLHKKCGIKDKEGDDILFLCRFRKSSLTDATLTQEWGLQPRQRSRKPGIAVGLTEVQKAAHEEERNKKIAIKAHELNAWLTTIDQILCKLEKGKLCYYGRERDNNNPKQLYDRFVEETLCEFYQKELSDIQAVKKIWHDIPSKLLKFIHSHGRCYSNETVFDAYHLCESQQWQFIKFNAEVEQTKFLVDLEEDFDRTTDGYFSLTNDKTKGPEVKFVPLYYMRVWTLVCGKDLVPGQENEVTNIDRHAKKFRNRWVEIPTGAYKRKFQDLDKYDVNVPKSFRLQPVGERSCVFNSLINALHYINDYAGRDQLLKNLQTSLNYEKMSLVSHSRAALAAQIMNKEVTGYQIQILKNFDILENRSMWPTLCVLKGSDFSINHAITVVENYIFDSNRSCAMKLMKSYLDWRCSDFAGEQKFVAVHTAYRFNKIKPRPETLLRCPDQRILGISSIIHAMQHMDKNLLQDNVVPALAELRGTIEPNQCVIANVRELLKMKRFGYRPIILKHIIDVMQQQYSPWPSIILIHATGTFHYRIVSIVGDTLFDGTQGPSLQLTVENLYYSVNSELLHQDEVTSVELIFGYRFVKDKVGDNIVTNKGGESIMKNKVEDKKRKIEQMDDKDVQPSCN
jgi:hypothetical protein